MAEFNKCAGLVDQEKVNNINTYYTQSVAFDPFGFCIDMQRELQKMYTSKHNRQKPPSELETKGELIDFLYDQKNAIDDEFRELIEAVHGMSRPASERSAGWKKWKSKYDEIRAEKINEGLSEDDQAERSMEMIDIMHFIMNMLIALNIDEKDFFTYYLLKNEENFDRQKNNY